MKKTIRILIATAVFVFTVSSQALAFPLIPLPPADANFFINLIMCWFFW